MSVLFIAKWRTKSEKDTVYITARLKSFFIGRYAELKDASVGGYDDIEKLRLEIKDLKDIIERTFDTKADNLDIRIVPAMVKIGRWPFRLMRIIQMATFIIS